MIDKFMQDTEEFDAFITGPAGTGKTTALKEVCEYLLNTNYTFQVVAYTHKAKQVLQSKLPKMTPISTLHSFLKKRPGINEKAKHLKAIMTSNQHGVPETLDLLIIDEYSFVGEKDDVSLCELQDPMYVDKPLKILYVGDNNQLPPIGAPSNLVPGGSYWTKLTKIHRTDNDILPVLGKLVDFIEGNKKPSYLKSTENFLRKQDIKSLYMQNTESNKILLAFTNQKVQQFNFEIQGRSEPIQDDILFISSLRIVVKFKQMVTKPVNVTTPMGVTIDELTKYNPLKFLKTLSYVDFMDVEVVKSFNDKISIGSNITIACIFGTFENKNIRSKLGSLLVKLNKKGENSKQVYREYKTVNDYVCIADFNHCMTIHKSQGSEYDYVYLDAEDLKCCIDIVTRLKLLYVGISRAKLKVFLNN